VKFRAADFNGWQTAYALDIVRAVPGAANDTSASRAKFLDAAARFDSELRALESLSASAEAARTVGAALALISAILAELRQRAVADRAREAQPVSATT
jgi:two-component system cell cycle sensor histidine kinase/response regulator CckA